MSEKHYQASLSEIHEALQNADTFDNACRRWRDSSLVLWATLIAEFRRRWWIWNEFRERLDEGDQSPVMLHGDTRAALHVLAAPMDIRDELVMVRFDEDGRRRLSTEVERAAEAIMLMVHSSSLSAKELAAIFSRMGHVQQEFHEVEIGDMRRSLKGWAEERE